MVTIDEGERPAQEDRAGASAASLGPEWAAATVGVVGAGVMGAGIAQSLAVAGVGAVVCVDRTEAALTAARSSVEDGRYGLRRAVEIGRLAPEAAERAAAALSYTTDREALGGARLVVESVYEDLGLKVGIFRELDDELDGAAVIASNTSGFPITALAAATRRPDKVIGWHWASPAVVQRMAEIVSTPSTSAETIDTVTMLANACGKNPVLVKDTPQSWGFVANRIFRAARLEAQRVVDEGIADEVSVDRLMKDCFRWPAGPFELIGGARSNWSDR